MENLSNVRYSESIKLRIVSEIETGSIDCTGASKKYGISYTTVKQWVLKYGILKRIPKLLRVETPEEQSRVKKLEQENKKLRKALSDAMLDKDISQIQLEIFCEKMGIDYEEVKKKAEEKRLEELRRRGIL